MAGQDKKKAGKAGAKGEAGPVISMCSRDPSRQVPEGEEG